MGATLRVGRALTVRQHALVSCCSNSPATRERATLWGTVRSCRRWLAGAQLGQPNRRFGLRSLAGLKCSLRLRKLLDRLWATIRTMEG
jgi:hypothetical protein